MSYSEALEQQLALYKHLRGRPDHLPEQTPTGKGRGDSMLDALRCGDTYFWSSAMCDLLQGTLNTFPRESGWDQEMLPTPLGFVWFQKPLGWRAQVSGPEVRVWVKAITWRLGELEGIGGVGVNLGAVWSGSEHQYENYFLDQWYMSQSLEDHVIENVGGNDDESDVASILIDTIFAASAVLLNQRILVAPHHRAERHSRKRLERDGWTAEPLIRVVELRRRQSRQAFNGESEPVDWSCQWVVGGHWHNFWTGKKDGQQVLQPRWIMPYVKGPENKPLKPPRAKVFAVVR